MINEVIFSASSIIRRNRPVIVLLLFLLTGCILLFSKQKELAGQDASKAVELQTREASRKTVDLQIREAKWETVVELLKKQKNKKTQRLPDVIGIGVEKCGTHALFQFLTPHPLLAMREPMEAHHWDAKYLRGETLDQYRLSMPYAEDMVLIAEKTPAYFNFRNAETPALIREHLPAAKCILQLCNPAKRVISDFAQEKATKNPHILALPTVEDYLTDELLREMQKFDVEPSMETAKAIIEDDIRDSGHHLLTTGFYEHHIFRWLPHFNSSNLLVIDSDELMTDPGTVIERVQEFLGMPKLLLKEDYVRDPETGFFCYKNHVTDKLQCLSVAKQRTRNGNVKTLPSTLAKLNQLFQPHIARLEKLVGRKFQWGK